jgi:hypothetical protein
MAVVVEINKNGKKSYKSANPGIISDDDLRKADKLDRLISIKLFDFIKENKIDKVKKDRVALYWELGKILRDIYFNSKLIGDEEKQLFFENIRIHLPNDLFPKDDKTRKRNIPQQFFKLAGYPYELAIKIKWSQWSYLFDNKYLIENTGFDKWFTEILKSNRYVFSESFTRLWAEGFNLLFKGTDISDWTESEFFKSLICSLNIVQKFVECGIEIDSRRIRKDVRISLMKTLKNHKKEFILMQMGKISENEFVDFISSKAKQQVLQKT